MSKMIGQYIFGCVFFLYNIARHILSEWDFNIKNMLSILMLKRININLPAALAAAAALWAVNVIKKQKLSKHCQYFIQRILVTH